MLEKLKKLLGISNSAQDELLNVLLEQEQSKVLNYTRRDELPETLQPVVVSLALIAYNRQGAEGENSRSEGGISQSFVGGIPEEIKMQLNRFIKARVVGQ